MAAARDVPPSTAFLYVPQELQINKHTIKARAPELWEVYEKHPEIFKKHYDSEYLRLIVFVYYEMLKGDQSFYHPYFAVISETDLPMTWSEDELTEFQDQVLKITILNYKKEYEEEWILVKKTLDLYPNLFPGINDVLQHENMYKLFTRAFINVVTRCFGWGLPCTTMVPFADFINHHNVDSSYELISRDEDPNISDEQMRSLPKAYYTQSKKEIDYSDVFLNQKEENECEIEDFKISNNRSLNYIRLIEARKEAKNTQQTLAKIIHSVPMNIWDVNYLSTSDDDDNDEESSDEDENSDEAEY